MKGKERTMQKRINQNNIETGKVGSHRHINIYTTRQEEETSVEIPYH